MDKLRMVTPRAQRDEPGLNVNGLSIRMALSLRKTPTCEGRGGRLPSFETLVVPATYSMKLSSKAQLPPGSPCTGGVSVQPLPRLPS
jgi:hypothetical protein